MNKISRKNNGANNESDINKFTESKSIRQEELRQSCFKFNLASIIIVVSASFCFTGIGFFWAGKLSEGTAMKTVDLASKVVTYLCLPLIKSSRNQLNQLTEELEENPKKDNNE